MQLEQELKRAAERRSNSNSSRVTTCCLLLLIILLCSSSCAAASVVRTAQQLRSALLDAGSSSIVLAESVTLDPATFAPAVSLTRAVSITADSPAATYLDLGNAQEPLISIAAGGNLTLRGLQLANIHPALPLPVTQASSAMPLSAISITSRSAAALSIVDCALLVEGPLSNVTDTLPFWAARQEDGVLRPIQQQQQLQHAAVAAAAAAAATGTALSSSPSSSPAAPSASSSSHVLSISNYSTTLFGGSSRVQLANTVVLTDLSRCGVTPGQQLLAWDSASLALALNASSTTTSSSTAAAAALPEIVLLANVSLSPVHWPAPTPGNGNTPSVQISSCSSSSSYAAAPTILDFNHLPGVFLLQPGATLQFSSRSASSSSTSSSSAPSEGPFLLLNAAPVSLQYGTSNLQLSWPRSNLSSSAHTLLGLGSVDVSQGGTLLLSNVAVGVADAAAARDAMQQVTGAGGSKPVLSSSQPGGSGSGGGGSGFAVSSWNTSLGGWHLGGNSAVLPAAQGARLVLQEVQVFQAPTLCSLLQQPEQQHQDADARSSLAVVSSGVAVASTNAELLTALTDPDISIVLLVEDITFTNSCWQGMQRVRLRRPLLFHGCSSAPGSRVVLDFSELQGDVIFQVASPLTFSGELELRGLPDHRGVPGSWLLMPLLQLVGPGSLDFQGVQLHGHSAPMLDQLDSAALGRPSHVDVGGNSALVNMITLPSSAAGRLLGYNTSTGRSSSGSTSVNKLNSSHSRHRSLLAAAAGDDAAASSTRSTTSTTTSSSSTAPATGYYCWVGTPLSWGPRTAAAQHRGLHDAGSIAAVVLASVLALIGILAAAALFVQHRRRQQQRRWGLVPPAKASKPSPRNCWGLCGSAAQHTMPPSDYHPHSYAHDGGAGSSHGGFMGGWGAATAAAQHGHAPPGTSVLASFNSSVRPTYGDSFVRAFNSDGSVRGPSGRGGLNDGSVRGGGQHGGLYSSADAAAAAAAGGHHHLHVHTSPNSATTTVMSNVIRGGVGASAVGVDAAAAAASLYDFVQKHQQYQHGAEGGEILVHEGGQRAGAAAGAGMLSPDGLTAAAAAAAAAGLEYGLEGTGTTAGDDEAGDAGGGGGQHKGGGGAGGFGQHKQQVFEAARRQLGATAGDLARSDALVLEAVLGEGSFGKVFRGYWKGTLVAVKTMMFPAAMSGKEKREKMAIMETAISASLSHPNIVQMYTYYLRPVLVGHEATMTGEAAEEALRLDSSSVGDSTMNAAFLNEGLSDSVHSWEVQLVLEFCDKGSLRNLLNKQGPFQAADGRRNMVMILDTALDVARAMVHLHSENIIHSDLKARNILLKSSGGAEGRPFVAKVADFGLSMRIDPNATHVSNVYQGTMTHMAPEVMLRGKLSRQSDVYAFGVLLWELYSGGHAFKGIPRALLGHEVAHQQRRPQFPDDCPFDLQLLACRCWESDASIRPSFSEILGELLRMRERVAAAAAAEKAASDSQQLAAAAAAADASAHAAAAAAGPGRPHSEPIQSQAQPTTVAAVAPAASASDPVHAVSGAARGTAAAAGAVAASAAVIAAAAATAAALGAGGATDAAAGSHQQGVTDAAAGPSPAAAADNAAGAAASALQQQQQQQHEGGGVVGPLSGPMQTSSVPLLLPAPDPAAQQHQQQDAVHQMRQSTPSPQHQLLAQQQAVLTAAGPQQQPLSQAGLLGLHPADALQQQQQQQGTHMQVPAAAAGAVIAPAAAAGAAPRRASSLMREQAVLEELIVQVSMTGGSSMAAGGLVVHPAAHHAHAHALHEHTRLQPLPSCTTSEQPSLDTEGAAGTSVPAGDLAAATAGVGVGVPSAAATGAAAAAVGGTVFAAAANAGSNHLDGQQQQQQHPQQQLQMQRGESSGVYYDESSTFAACGPGVMLYGATRHRQAHAGPAVDASTCTSEEPSRPSSRSGATATAAAAGGSVAAGEQQQRQEEGAAVATAAASGKKAALQQSTDHSSEHDQLPQVLAADAPSLQQQQRQQQALCADAAPQNASEAADSSAAAAVGDTEVSSAAQRTPKGSSRFSQHLQRLSSAAARTFRRAGSSSNSRSAAATPQPSGPPAAAVVDASASKGSTAAAPGPAPASAAPNANGVVGDFAAVVAAAAAATGAAAAAASTASQQQGASSNHQQEQQHAPASSTSLSPAGASTAAAGAAAAGGLFVEPESESAGSRSITVYSSGSSSQLRSSSYSDGGSSTSGDDEDEDGEEERQNGGNAGGEGGSGAGGQQRHGHGHAQQQLSESEAALAAVMSLKASLAKQAFAGLAQQRAASRGGGAGAGAARLSVDAGVAAAAAAASGAAAGGGGATSRPVRYSVDLVSGPAGAQAGVAARASAVAATAMPPIGQHGLYSMARTPPSPLQHQQYQHQQQQLAVSAPHWSSTAAAGVGLQGRPLSDVMLPALPSPGGPWVFNPVVAVAGDGGQVLSPPPMRQQAFSGPILRITSPGVVGGMGLHSSSRPPPSPVHTSAPVVQDPAAAAAAAASLLDHLQQQNQQRWTAAGRGVVVGGTPGNSPEPSHQPLATVKVGVGVALPSGGLGGVGVVSSSQVGPFGGGQSAFAAAAAADGGGTQPAAGAGGRLPRSTSTDVASAAAGAADPHHHPAPHSSKSWHTGLTNLATQLLPPAFSGGPRSPKQQQEQEQPSAPAAAAGPPRVASRWTAGSIWKPPVRKTVSASQLGSSSSAAAAAGHGVSGGAHGGGVSSGGRQSGGLGLQQQLHSTPSQPLMHTHALSQPLSPVLVEEEVAGAVGETAGQQSAAGVRVPTGRASVQLPISGAEDSHHRQQQQGRRSLQLPLVVGGSQQHMGLPSSSSSSGAAAGTGTAAQHDQQLPAGLSGLDAAQIALLAQIADAARSQVAPLSFVSEPSVNGDTAGDSVVTQQRWRSAPNGGFGGQEAAAAQGPFSQQQLQLQRQQQVQQLQQATRPRPRHAASFSNAGVQFYSNSSNNVVGGGAGAGGLGSPQSGGGGGVGGVAGSRVPPKPVSGGSHSSQQQQGRVPNGRQRRSSAPTVGQQQQQMQLQRLQQQLHLQQQQLGQQ